MPPLYLIDAPIFFFRAYFSVPDHIYTDQGHSLNAVIGYSHFLLDLIVNKRPQNAVAAFDESLGSCFRNDLYPQYKSSRPLPDDNIKFQFEQCKKLTQLCGIQVLASNRYEADDLLASCAAIHQGQRILVTRDKDLWQLLRQGDTCWDGKYAIGYDTCGEKMGVRPEQIADYLALMGDAVDDIPGVPGIGKKTAAALLAKYENIETLYHNLHQFKDWSIRGSSRICEQLQEYREQVFLMKKLTRLDHQASMAIESHTMLCNSYDEAGLLSLAEALGLPKSIKNKMIKTGSGQ